MSRRHALSALVTGMLVWTAPAFAAAPMPQVDVFKSPYCGCCGALRVPFGTASRNEPLMATALSEVELAEATQRELQQQLDAEVATARHAVDSARQQARDETTRAKLLRERATLIDKSFKAGETPLPELLRAVTAAAQAEAAVSRAQAALAQAASRLQQALGVMP